MFGLMNAWRQKVRYRRRWGRLAAAATAAADSATANLVRREDDRRSRQEERPRHPASTRRTGRE